MAVGGSMTIALALLVNAVLLGALVVVLIRSRAPEKVFAAVVLLWLPAPVVSFVAGALL